MTTEPIVLQIHCTPNELRAIADNLDLAWEKVRLGQEAPKEIVWVETGQLHFIIDQDNIGRSPGIPREG